MTDPDPAVNGPRADTDAGEHLEDVRCIRELRAHRPEAWTSLVRRHSPRLHALLRRFFSNAEDVDDILQESWMRAYRSLDRFDPTREFYPWIRKIAVNLAIDELNRRKRSTEVADSEATLERIAVAPEGDRNLARTEIAQAVEEALDSIPPDWAAVFRLRNLEEMSYAEIAQTLDIPGGTVMSRLARARSRLATILARRLGSYPEATS